MRCLVNKSSRNSGVSSYGTSAEKHLTVKGPVSKQQHAAPQADVTHFIDCFAKHVLHANIWATNLQDSVTVTHDKQAPVTHACLWLAMGWPVTANDLLILIIHISLGLGKDEADY